MHLRWGNTGEHCGRCKQALERGYQPLEEGPVCKGDGCSSKLRRGKYRRKDGLCSPCGAAADVKARGCKGKHARQVLLYGVKCSNCPRKIARGTKTGLCKECIGHDRARGGTLRTRLQARSESEFEADRTWARLGAKDKWALLGSYLGEQSAVIA